MKLKLLAYLSIIIFSLVSILLSQKYVTKASIIGGYVENFSVNRGNEVCAYLQTDKSLPKARIVIYDVYGQAVDSFNSEISILDTIVKDKQYEFGYGFTEKIKYNTSKLKSGIYYFGRIVPFLVKEVQKRNSITVVYPFANMMAINNDGGKSFDPGNSSNQVAARKLSLNRPLKTINNPDYFIQWLDSVQDFNQINYISDLDLLDYANIANSKLLILYSYSSFWSLEQRLNFDKFIANGNSFLSMNTYLMNNKFKIDAKQNSIYFYGWGDTTNSIEERTGVWFDTFYNYPNTNSVYCSNEITLDKKENFKCNDEYTIMDKSHPIFSSTKNEQVLSIDNHSNVSAIPVKKKSDLYVPIPKENQNFEATILAYDYFDNGSKTAVTGIVELLHKKSKSKSIIISNEKWCWPNYFNDSGKRNITKDCIKFLLK